jgi:predicted NAD-dependent protein-ADP-ribosyltransferase YbiA (DUF1768 family)
MFLTLILFIFSFEAMSEEYPDHWWQPVDPESAPEWEILPQAANREAGEVILSKRNELGILSNFAATPFVFKGMRYQSVEGFWQMMKYPEGTNDPRLADPNIVWPFTREQVSQMTGHEAKRAGDLASENMRKLNINWVTFKGKQLVYRTPERGEHYKLIVAAMKAKLKQNILVKEILLKTGDLKLLPDHRQGSNVSPAWEYFEIWMELRKQTSF